MLPRLQDLHDRRRCVIFLATHHLGKIDPAIIRPGRFDYSVFVDHPKVKRFTNDDSYFKNPGLPTLRKLKIGFDYQQMKVDRVDEARLSQLSAAVKTALNTKNVQKELISFNESYADETSAASPGLKAPTKKPTSGAARNNIEELYVWFKFIEAALEAASAALEASPDKLDTKHVEAATRAAAVSKLVAEISYQLK